mgnify:FL=1
MTFIKGDLKVSQLNHLRDIFPNFWILEDDLVYQGKDETFTVPKDFVTDFATVPQFLQWIIPRTGAWNRAVIVHDYFCDRLGEEYYNEGFFENEGPFPGSRDADGIFRRILREEGVPFVKRWLIWTGVRWGALFNKSRRPGIMKDIPLMAILSLLFLPIILPATVGVAVGNAAYEVYDLTSRGASWVSGVLRK